MPKLKTKLKFRFDTEELEETIPEFNYDIKLKTKGKKTNINIIKIRQKKTLDASTKLF